MKSLWALQNMSWLELAKRVWKETMEDRVFGRAAELSYYFLLALFPLLLFLMSIAGIALGEGTETRQQLFDYLARIMPPSAFQLVKGTITEVSAGSSGGKISFGVLAALWAASNGMSAITESLNVAYDVEESRPWWKARLVAIGLTIALSVLILSALLLVIAGSHIGTTLGGYLGYSSAFATAWSIIQWPVVFAFMILAFALIYYFAPDLRRQAWHWLTPGAAIGVVLWLLVSLAFRIYLQYFDSYNKTYGSLGAVIILMLWLYFTGIAVLIGGEINSEIENAAAEQGAPEAKERGEKSPQENEAKTGRLVAQR
jgi:membrane protein